MSTETLRALSRAYATGNIDRESYLRTRREMLRRVVAGDLPLVAFHAPEPEMPTVFPYDENEGDTTQEIIPSVAVGVRAQTSAGKRSPLLAIVIAVGVIAVAAYATFQALGRGAAPPSVDAAPAAATTTTNLLDEFLAARTWTAASMNTLANAWDALPEATRHQLMQSESANRLTAAVLQQIRAAEALLELGEADDALETESLLLGLVEHLGFSNTRLELARQRWNEARIAQDTASATLLPATVVAGDGTAADNEATVANGAETPDPGVGVIAPPEPIPTTDLPATPETSAPTADAGVAAAVQDPVPAIAAKPMTPAVSTMAPAVAASSSAKTNASSAKPAASATVRSNCRAALTRTRRPYCIDVAGDGTKGPLLVVLPAGRYTMGGRETNEQPRHEITLALPFAIGMFEVSAREFALFCAATGATCPAQPWNKPAYPVVNVSWAQAEAYAKWLSRLLSADYRLATEAEWEYAARGGSTSEYPLGDELLPTHARYSYKNKLDEPLPANDRSLNRNEFRLYHIIGNVREWVADTWAETYAGAAADGSAHSGGGEHVVRGGSYADAADALRSAARLPLATSDAQTGFRLVRQVD